MGSFKHPKDLAHENIKLKTVLDANSFPQFVGRAPAGAQDSDKIWQLSEQTWNNTSKALVTQEYAQDNGGEESNEFKYSFVATPTTDEIIIRGKVVAGNTLTVDVDGTAVTAAFDTDHDTTVSNWATSLAAKNPVAQIQELTIDAALVASNVIHTTVDGGTPVDTTFATDSNTTLAAHATALAMEAGIATAVVTDAGGGSDDDRVIVITSATAGTPTVLTEFNVTAGASQAGVTIADTTVNEVGISTATVRSPGSQVIVVVAETNFAPLVLDAEGVTGTQINSSVSIRETVAQQLAPASMTYGA